MDTVDGCEILHQLMVYPLILDGFQLVMIGVLRMFFLDRSLYIHRSCNVFVSLRK